LRECLRIGQTAQRTPYKVQITDPTEPTFRSLLLLLADKLGFVEGMPDAVDYLIDHHYRRTGRPFRSCQPRDLLLQARYYCVYNGEPLRLTTDVVDFSVRCYFTAV
jgi:hypothetical protein